MFFFPISIWHGLLLLTIGASYLIAWVISRSPASSVQPSSSEWLQWSLAIWTSHLACVLPRDACFWPNGGAPDVVSIYPFAVLQTLVVSRLLARSPVIKPLSRFLIGTTLLSAMVALLVSLWGGHGDWGVITPAILTSAVGAAVSLLAWIRDTKSLREATAEGAVPGGGQR